MFKLPRYCEVTIGDFMLSEEGCEFHNMSSIQNFSNAVTRWYKWWSLKHLKWPFRRRLPMEKQENINNLLMHQIQENDKTLNVGLLEARVAALWQCIYDLQDKNAALERRIVELEKGSE